MRVRFPGAHVPRQGPADVAEPGKCFEIETFPTGGISEVIPAGPVAVILLLVAGLLRDSEETSPHPEFVLIDAGDTFDPRSFSREACAKMLWVRCSAVQQMVKAADLVINDGNVPFVILDGTCISRQELTTISSSSWRRLKLGAERSGGRVVVLAPCPVVSCASLRLTLSADLSLHDFDSTPEVLLQRLVPSVPALRRVT